MSKILTLCICGVFLTVILSIYLIYKMTNYTEINNNINNDILDIDMHIPTYNENDLIECVHLHLKPLLNDWRQVNGGHRVKLLAHSVWTVFGMNVIENSPENEIIYEYVRYLTPNMRRIGVLASLLHDVGKGGTGKIKGRKHKLHPQAGEDILLNKLDYKFINGENLVLGSYLLQNCPKVFNLLTLRMVALITGMHYEMEHPKPISYIRAFNTHLRKTELENAVPDSVKMQLLRLCIALSAADVMGGRPVKNPKHWLLNELQSNDLIPNKEFSIPLSGPWQRYKYGIRGSNSIISRMEKIVKNFEKSLLLGTSVGSLKLEKISRHIHKNRLKREKKQRKKVAAAAAAGISKYKTKQKNRKKYRNFTS